MTPELEFDDNSDRGSGWFRLLKEFDYVQLAALGALLGIGVAFIASTGEQVGTRVAEGAYLRQLQWILLGGALWLLFALTDYRNLLVPSGLFYLGALGLLVAVLKIGVTVYNAQRWIQVPGLGIRLQPSEFTKLAVILMLSAIFASRKFEINSLRCLTLSAAVVVVPFYLIAREPDLGSALILVPIAVVLIFAAGMRWKYMIWSLSAVILLTGAITVNEFLAYKPLLKDYQRARIVAFLNPARDPYHRGWNQQQARLAVGSGGLTGKGFGLGTQNELGFLPQSVSNNDFIFSVIAEETGFVGCMGVFAAYLLLLYSLLRTAYLAGDPFGRYLALGIATMLFIHCFINIGMSLGVMPVTGLPLPFVSYGGSFLLMGMAALGITQSVWRKRRRDEYS